MSPAALEDIGDELFAAMVRRMIREAEAIQASNNKLPKR